MIPTPPDRTEAAEYYYGYIDQVPRDGDVRRILEAQRDEVVGVMKGISEEKSFHRYAPGKWSIRETMSHINDAERLFTFRAMWFARGFDSPLPSFEQDVAIAGAHADDRALSSHVEEFRAIRSATLHLFDSLADDAWSRRGIASDNPFTVRALAYITAGHVAHHLAILKQRYL